MHTVDAARLALWCNASAQGVVPPDAATHALGPVRILGAEGALERSAPVELAALRATGGVRLRLVLLVNGDAGGLAASPAVLGEAMVAQAALVLEPIDAHPTDVPRAWIPSTLNGRGTVLSEHQLLAPLTGQEDVATSSRQLLQAMADAAAALEALDVAGGRSHAEPSLRHVERALAAPPPGVDPRAQTLLHRALAALVAVEVAQADTARAWSASQQRARADALVALARAARRGVEAAVGPGWAGPPGRLDGPIT